MDTNFCNGAIDNPTEGVYDDYFDNDDGAEDHLNEEEDSLNVKEEIPKKSRTPASKRYEEILFILFKIENLEKLIK